MKAFCIALLSVGILACASCEKIGGKNGGECQEPPTTVVKFKGEYADKVCVLLDAGKTRIVGYPSPSDCAGDTVRHALQALADGYYIARCGLYGINSAILKVTRKEYNEGVSIGKSKEEIYGNILDKDPFLEYYEDRDEFLVTRAGEEDDEFDKANKMIANGELASKLKRIK